MTTENSPSHPGHYIREWRVHRGLSLKELAAHLDVTHGQLSRIETGKQPYSQHILESASGALRTDVASLLTRAPDSEHDGPPMTRARRLESFQIPHLFIKEWQKAKNLTSEEVAAKLQIHSKTYYRLIREQDSRVNLKKMARLAWALDLRHPLELLMGPNQSSLDAIVADAPSETRELAADIVRRLIESKANGARAADNDRDPQLHRRKRPTIKPTA